MNRFGKKPACVFDSDESKDPVEERIEHGFNNGLQGVMGYLDKESQDAINVVRELVL